MNTRSCIASASFEPHVAFKNTMPVRCRMRTLFAAAAVVLLAGCVIPSEPDASATSVETAPALPPVDAKTYKITLDWVVSSVQANQSFTFPMRVDGNVSSPSTHIGAHYWTFSQANPTTANALKCDHMVGEKRVPNDFDVTCTPVAPGHYFMRGHVQMTRGSELINWWSDEHEFDVHG